MRKTNYPSVSNRSALLAFLLAFLFLTISGRQFGLSFPEENWLGQLPPVPNNDRYIVSEAYSDKSPDLYSYYYDINGCMEKARQADILIVGNSKSFFAFRNPFISDFTKKTGLKIFNLSMQYGGGLNIALPLIKKYQLRPRFLIINENHFFTSYSTPYDQETVSMGSWRAHFLVWELNTAWNIRAFYHHLFPRFSFGKLFGSLPIVTYRSITNGCLTAENFPEYLVPVSQKSRLEEALTTEELKNAVEFKRAMEKQGTKIILTSVPYGTDDMDHLEKWVQSNEKRAFIAKAEETYERIDKVAKQLGLPCLTVNLPGLYTFDGRHLDATSAEKFTTSFLRHLLPTAQ